MAFEGDEYHMLNCASTFCWDALVSNCEEAIQLIKTNSSSKHLDLHQENSPSSVSTILQNQLSATDQWGNTALHAACYNSPPVEAIRAILRVASFVDAAADHSSPPITSIRSGDGSTPLLIACATGSSVEVIDLLMNGLKDDAEKEHNNNKKTCKQRGVEVSIPDHRGNTPLSDLCQNYETQRKSLVNYSSHGGTSVHTHPKFESINNIDEACQRCNTFCIFWEKVVSILEGGTRDLPEFLLTKYKASAESNLSLQACTASTAKLLHKCAAMAAFCPPCIAKLISRSTPLDAQSRNELGFLPLHLAIISEEFSSSKPFRRYQHHSSLAHNRSEIIRILLDAFPEAARISIPGSGRTPLCAAIASGLEWHLGNSSTTSFSDTKVQENEKYRGPLWSIWKQSPESHCSRDVVTGLYPFMLAASADSMAFQVNLDRKYEGEYMDHNIDAVYSLLRLHPQVIQECCVMD